MDSYKIYYIGLILTILMLSPLVGAECIQRVFLTNQLEDSDLSDYVVVYQNDNLSRRWIKDVNYTEGSFNINCNVTYDFYIPAESDLIEKNILHSNWINFMFFAFLGLILLVIFIALVGFAIRWGLKLK